MALIANGRQETLARDTLWMSTKPGEIVWHLIQAQNSEFDYFLPEDILFLSL